MIRNIIQIVFRFLIVFIIVVCVSYIFFHFLLKQHNKNKKMNGLRQKIFGFLMELDDISIFAISVHCVCSIFLFYMYMNRATLGMLHLYTLIFLSFLFGICSKSIKNLLLTLGSNIAFYFSLISSKVLSNYLAEVQFVWYVLLGNFLLLFFIGLCIIYFFIRNINDVVSRTKYIRRYRNEEI